MLATHRTKLEPSRQQSRPAPTEPSSLRALGFLVGGVWVSEIEAGKDVVKYTEECRWVLDHQFIFTVTSIAVNGKVAKRTRGCFGWHPGEQKLVQWSFNSDGDMSFGREVPGNTLAGRQWTFNVELVGREADADEVTITRVSEDEMLLVVEPTGSSPTATTAGRIARTYVRQR